eukprot:15359883-Ditylum_brightwellii.AAC.1
MSKQQQASPGSTTDTNQETRSTERDRWYIENHVAESFVDDTACTYLDQQDQQNETPTRIRDRLQSIAQT